MRKMSVPALLLAAFTPVAATAVPVTFEFTGALSSRSWSGSGESWYAFEFPFVTDYSGSFTLETDTAPVFTSGNFADYRNLLTDLSVSFGPGGSLGTYVLGDQLFPAGTPYQSSLFALNDIELPGSSEPFDQLGMNATLGAVAGDAPNMLRSISISGLSYTGALFAELPTLDQFPTGEFDPAPPWPFVASWNLSIGVQLLDESGQTTASAGFGGNITSIRRVASSVPEPGTWALMLSGLAAAALLRRRRPAV